MRKTWSMVLPMLLASWLLLAHQPALAVADEPSAAVEKRVTRLTEELRCLVCQNQTIADSHADLAIDLRKQVREKVAQGLSDQAVLDFMVERYGDFVLYRPPVKSTTWALWFGPFLLLLIGLGLLLRKLRENPSPRQAALADGGLGDITEADLARASALLRSDALPAMKEEDKP